MLLLLLSLHTVRVVSIFLLLMALLRGKLREEEKEHYS